MSKKISKNNRKRMKGKWHVIRYYKNKNVSQI
nr:MAG TPA: hypothetical protein [Caudoviricetes sp.]